MHDEPTSFYAMKTNLVGEGRMGGLNIIFAIAKEAVFIAHECSKIGNLNIKASYLFFCTEDFEITVHRHTASRGSPRPASNILACIPKEIKVGQKGILNNFFPSKQGTRGFEFSSSEIVLE
jgi:hypothetical protein